MPQEVRKRKQGTVAYEGNTKVPMSLGRGMVYRELYLRLYGQPTIDTTKNLAASTLRGDEWACIQRIDLIANNTDVLKSLSGNALWWLNFFLYGRPPRITATLGDGSTASPAFDSVLVLPLWMPRSIRPIDTALDARNLSDLKIEITWGTYASINADASAWTVEPKLDVYSLESFNVKGPFSQWRVYTIEKEVTATNTQFTIDLPVGPMYRGFMVNTTDTAKDDGSILNNLKVLSGTTVYADLCEEVLEQAEMERNQTMRYWDDGGGVYDPLRRGTTYNNLDGWYFYDHCTDGYLTESIDTLGFSEFKLELDVTVGSGTTKVFVYPQQVIPVRGKK